MVFVVGLFFGFLCVFVLLCPFIGWFLKGKPEGSQSRFWRGALKQRQTHIVDGRNPAQKKPWNDTIPLHIPEQTIVSFGFISLLEAISHPFTVCARIPSPCFFVRGQRTDPFWTRSVVKSLRFRRFDRWVPEQCQDQHDAPHRRVDGRQQHQRGHLTTKEPAPGCYTTTNKRPTT